MTPYAQIITFLFLMLGPFKIIAPFAKITVGADPSLTKKIAFRSILYASIALLLAGSLGETILSKYGIPIPILALAGGIVIFLVALLEIIKQFTPHETPEANQITPSLKMAMNPLAFPTIVTPYGIATIIVFLSMFSDSRSQLIIAAIIVGIMLLNLVTMLVTKRIFKYLSVVLPILGAVLGIVQVALGLLIIYNQLKELVGI
ncbi:MarC family protein [Eudoraea adriatica]|uniref:MarC family protein n=1 Tax=Eudoraea adriatica TaxID=446681 RepID=UPI000A04F262|nr:MarC family protein [Eudoraea adriatica]